MFPDRSLYTNLSCSTTQDFQARQVLVRGSVAEVDKPCRKPELLGYAVDRPSVCTKL